jgi:hypothetical protein
VLAEMARQILHLGPERRELAVAAIGASASSSTCTNGTARSVRR